MQPASRPPSIRSLILQYAILVGLPFLGVLAVLRAGSGLPAPRSVAGAWQLEGQLEANASTPCAAVFRGLAASGIVISQSGKFLQIHLPNSSAGWLSGTLDGNRFVAEAPPAPFGDDVFGLVRISGRVESVRNQPVIHGLLAMPRKIECAPVPFRAYPLQPAPPLRLTPTAR